jgi:hypothetical protein
MAMTLISTTTVGAGGAAVIDLTAIPNTYTDLVLMLSLRSNTARASSGGYATVRFNGSSSTYARRILLGDGSSSASATDANATVLVNPSDATANTFNNAVITIPNYAGSTAKSFSVDAVNENNATTADMQLMAQSWSGTSAITQITLTPGAGSFVQYSVASLYGITKGSGGATVS